MCVDALWRAVHTHAHSHDISLALPRGLLAAPPTGGCVGVSRSGDSDAFVCALTETAFAVSRAHEALAQRTAELQAVEAVQAVQAVQAVEAVEELQAVEAVEASESGAGGGDDMGA
jgi:hypothetical protein